MQSEGGKGEEIEDRSEGGGRERRLRMQSEEEREETKIFKVERERLFAYGESGALEGSSSSRHGKLNKGTPACKEGE